MKASVRVYGIPRQSCHAVAMAQIVLLVLGLIASASFFPYSLIFYQFILLIGLLVPVYIIDPRVALVSKISIFGTFMLSACIFLAMLDITPSSILDSAGINLWSALVWEVSLFPDDLLWFSHTHASIQGYIQTHEHGEAGIRLLANLSGLYILPAWLTALFSAVLLFFPSRPVGDPLSTVAVDRILRSIFIFFLITFLITHSYLFEILFFDPTNHLNGHSRGNPYNIFSGDPRFDHLARIYAGFSLHVLLLWLLLLHFTIRQMINRTAQQGSSDV